MKLNKIFAAMMAVVTLVGFSACNQQGADVIKLKLNKMTLTVGQTYKVPVEQASGTITWATSDEKVATVDAEGVVTGVAEGNAAITATVGTAKATIDVTVGGSIPGGGIPDIDAPANGYVTFVIEIPEGTECNGIAFKGTRNSSWIDCSGEDTYIGEDAENVGPDKCIKFVAIPDYPNWYQATYKLGAEPWGDDNVLFAGKICLIYAGDASWQGQAVDWEYDENYTTSVHSISGDGNIQVSSTGLVYVKIGGWNKSECVVEVQHDVKVTLIVPTNECGFEIPSIVGSFNGWNATEIPMTLVSGETNKYEATIKAYPSDEFKFAGSVSGWDNEPLFYDAENDEVKGLDNVKVGDGTEFAFDCSTGKWKACDEGGEEGGEE